MRGQGLSLVAWKEEGGGRRKEGAGYCPLTSLPPSCLISGGGGGSPPPSTWHCFSQQPLKKAVTGAGRREDPLQGADPHYLSFSLSLDKNIFVLCLHVPCAHSHDIWDYSYYAC